METAIDQALLERVFARIDTYRAAMIDLQRELTAIPALGPDHQGEGEEAKAALLRVFLHAIAVPDIEEFPAPDPRVKDGLRPNLAARIRGQAPGRATWILSHLDIVPPGELSHWEDDPYKVIEHDDRIIGRGVEDNQQGMVASLFALKALKEEGITPPRDACILAVSDEETGSKFGLGYVLKARPDLFSAQDLILVPDAGDPKGTLMEVAEKSICWIRFVTRGKQCHASTPGAGRNAFKAASHLVVRLNSLYEKFANHDPLFEPPISTFEPTKKEANVPNINTIPGEDVFHLDCRVLPCYPLADVTAFIEEQCREIENQFGVIIEMSYPQKEQAAPATAADAPVVQALARAIRKVYAVEPKPMGIGGGTVAAFFRRAGLPAVVWSRLEEMAHQPNEYCLIDNMLGDSKVMAHLYLEP